ncbi:MAG: exo-alpha-sialidase [Deltaproteobacteria bacterium]|nr:exo-alpha-sialidase [Deltaproteobacteria bacterium]
MASKQPVLLAGGAVAAAAVFIFISLSRGPGNKKYLQEIAPPVTISAVTPDRGPLQGGTVLTVSGSEFASGLTVTIGGIQALNVSVASATSLSVTTPPGALGAADVTVSNGSSSATAERAFSYEGYEINRNLSKAVPVSSRQGGGGGSVRLSLALATAADGALVAVYGDDRRDLNGGIYFSRSTDGGSTWSASTLVNDGDRGLSPTSTQRWPTIATEPGGGIVAAWEDGRNARFYNVDFYFGRSTDNGATWAPNTKLNDNGPASGRERVVLAALGAGSIVAAWSDSRNGNADIYFTSSTDGGTTWSANRKVNDDSGAATQRHPAIVVSNGTIVIMWEDSRNVASNSNYDVYYSRSTDGGLTWSASTRLTVDGNFQGRPALATGPGGKLVAVWEDHRRHPYDYGLYTASSTDGGVSWSAQVATTPQQNSVTKQNHEVAVSSSGRVVVVWQHLGSAPDIMMTSDAGTGSWPSTPIQMNFDSPTYPRNQVCPSVAITGNTVFVGWQDDRNLAAGGPAITPDGYDIYTNRSTNLDAWSISATNLLTSVTFDSSNSKLFDDASGMGDQLRPVGAVGSDGSLLAAWVDNRRNQLDVYFARSTDGGATWPASVKVNDDTSVYPQDEPAIAADASGIVAVWKDYRSVASYDIYFSRSADDGVTWGTNRKVNSDTGNFAQDQPSVAVAPGVVAVAWRDYRNGAGDPDIYFARSTDGGATWSANVRLNSDGAGKHQLGPSVLAVGGALYVAWSDMRGSSYDLYYVKSTDGGVTWSANQRLDDDSGTGAAEAPRLAARPDGSMIVAAWQDSRSALSYGGRRIYVRQSSDGGATWSASRAVDDNVGGTGTRTAPVIAVSSSGVIGVAWQDTRAGKSYVGATNIPAPDVYFTRSADGGATWLQNRRLNDDVSPDVPAVVHSVPSIVFEAGGAFGVFWQDGRNRLPYMEYSQTRDVYFVRGWLK